MSFLAHSWGGRCVPLDEQDFRKRRNVPLSGWPFDRSAPEPFYEQSLLEVGEVNSSASTALPSEFVNGFCDFASPPLNRKQVACLTTITAADLASSARYRFQKFVGGLKRSTVSVNMSL